MAQMSFFKFLLHYLLDFSDKLQNQRMHLGCVDTSGNLVNIFCQLYHGVWEFLIIGTQKQCAKQLAFPIMSRL